MDIVTLSCLVLRVDRYDETIRSQRIPEAEPCCRPRNYTIATVQLTGERVGRILRRKGGGGRYVRDRRSRGLPRGHHELISLTLERSTNAHESVTNLPTAAEE